MRCMLIFAMLASLLAACSEAGAASNEPAQPSAQNTPAGSASKPTAAPTNTPATATGGPASLDIATIEGLVRADLARFLAVAPETITLVSSEARTWPDASLGCGLRQGVREPQRTSGYLVVLGHAGQTYRYHTDQRGAFVRCNLPVKPIDPIR